MSKKPLISVIVPLYNCERDISKCLDSLTRQTYNNIQIIIVNDGSVDNGGEVCQKYAKSDGRIEYHYQKNSGVSAARNNGIAYAEGEWIGFCDSDDYIETDMYEYLLGLSEKYGADIAQCAAVSELNNTKRTMYCPDKDIVIDSFADSEKDKLRYYSSTVWSKIFKADSVKGIGFDTKYALGEDLLFSVKAGLNAEKTVMGAKAKYHYVQRSGSACYTRVSAKDLASVRSALTEILDLLPEGSKAERFYFNEQLRNNFDICSKYVRYRPENSEKTVGEVRGELRDNLRYMLSSEDFSFKERLKARLIVKAWDLYSAVIRGKRREVPEN